MLQSLHLDPELFLQAIDGGPANAPMAQLNAKAMIAAVIAALRRPA